MVFYLQYAHISQRAHVHTFASVHIKPALIMDKEKEERLSYKKRSLREASGVTLGNSSLSLSRLRFPHCRLDCEISGEDLCRNVTHVNYMFTCSKARGRSYLLLQLP